ncbi:unnamed protein product [Polarella glacialis]|uniref:Uncharacterized protein n=1 Tax=Polarella glacialis TaxID=89957 RepID=A0A813KTL1_POLGL|nr:unnamed protein product [Polarella glacialis]
MRLTVNLSKQQQQQQQQQHLPTPSNNPFQTNKPLTINHSPNLESKNSVFRQKTKTRLRAGVLCREFPPLPSSHRLSSLELSFFKSICFQLCYSKCVFYYLLLFFV